MTLGSEALVPLGVGPTVLLVGFLIRFRNWTFLVAGYDEASGLDGDLVSNVVGNTTIRVGLATVALGVVAAFGVASPVIWVVYAVAVGRAVYRIQPGPDRTPA